MARSDWNRPSSFKGLEEGERRIRLFISYDGSSFSVKLKDGNIIENLRIPLFGKHNVLNSLVAVSIAFYLGINEKVIREALLQFTGTKHRFSKVLQPFPAPFHNIRHRLRL